MLRFTDVPRPAVALGAAGLLPALACLGAALFGPADWRDQVFLIGTLYAAVILSFLGGTWWALSCTQEQHPAALTQLLAFSVIPPLAAWVAAFFLNRASLIVMALLFIAGLAVDHRLLKQGLAPAWWFNLRLPLSAGMAILSLLIALAA
jgi:hypothetical protein